MEKAINSADYRAFLASLRAAREAAGITQVDLAGMLDVTQSWISNCETGQRRIDIVELRRWCLALGLSFSQFSTAFDLRARKRGR